MGTFNTYAHQTGGEVFAIDEHTFLIKSFNYDGLGQGLYHLLSIKCLTFHNPLDAYFWAGATVRPSNIGFIIPDENGKTNKLRRYDSKDIRIKLAEDKKIKSLKWLSVWDIRDNRNFADIYIPDDFEPPAPQEISEFSRDSNEVKSGPVVILDSKTIKIPDFNFDGLSQNAYFWVGMGPQPNSAGRRIPNEKG